MYDIALHLFLRSEARASTKAASLISSTGKAQHYIQAGINYQARTNYQTSFFS
jgi:hypothetical protein